MNKTIFYSWESDLPNKTNRSFQEHCIKKAVNRIKSSQHYSIEWNIDRDTKGESGTPDIVNTIFSKISRSDIFVADISIINSQGKKTPNPNVLIELGYAAKTLGWDNVICLMNTAYGVVEELPFDLKFRRPITYNYNEFDETKPKEQLISSLVNAITKMQSNSSTNNEIFEYLKVQIDDELLFVLNYLRYMIFPYNSDGSIISEYNYMLNIDRDKLVDLVRGNQFYGFQLFKNWEAKDKKFNQLLEKPMIINNLGNSKTSPIINIIKSMRTLEDLQRYEEIFELVECRNEKYKVVSAYEKIAEPTYA